MRKIQVRVTIRLIAGIAAMIPFALVPQLAEAQAQPPGALAQLASPNSCVGGSDECPTTGATGLGGSENVAVSLDGKNVYVIGSSDDAIAEFKRNDNGSLAQIGCIASLDDSTVTDCSNNATAIGLNSPVAIAISPDGKNVYVAAVDSHPFGTVAEFERNADGSLTQLGDGNNCISENGDASDCGTQTGYGIANPVALAVSPDGDNVYVADSTDSDVAVLSRDATTGGLSQATGDCIAESTDNGAGCSTSGTGLSSVDSLVVSPDGSNVYGGGDTSPGAISEFSRSSTDGSLTQLSGDNACVQEADDSSECGSNDSAHGLDSIRSLAVSPDGKNLYSTGNGPAGTVAEFSRSSTDGSLTQLGNGNDCIEETTSEGDCDNVQGIGLDGAYSVTVSPDGANVYVATNSDDCCTSALAEFSRSSVDGSLTQLTSPDNCVEDVNDEGTECGNENGLGLGGGGLAISPDGDNVYASGSVGDVAEFARGQHTLTVSLQGSGAVSDGTGGVACPSACSDTYTTDSQVTLTATAGSGSTFAGWSGGGCSGTGTCQVTMNADTNVTAMFISSPTPVLTGAPSAVTDGGAGFSGSVDPEGLPTTAYFQYGLDKQYSQVGASGANYTAQTQPQTVGSDFTDDAVGPVTVTGLVPNALYHVRMVATNSAGTTFGQDVTFTTAMAPAPGTPTLGETFNIEPVSGLVLIYINGQLVPLTQLTQIPAGVAIDTLHGTLKLTTATGGGGGGARDAAAKGKPRTQTGEFSGAVFRLSQQTRGAGKGLVTLMLGIGRASCRERV